MAMEADKPKAALEDLLRQWGAQEAARRQVVAAPPAARRRGDGVWRWVSLSAAAVLLGASAWVFLNARRPAASAVSPASPFHGATGQELATLRQERQALRGQLEAAQQQLKSQEELLASLRQQAGAWQAAMTEREAALRQAQSDAGGAQAALEASQASGAGKEAELGRLRQAVQAAEGKAMRATAAARSAGEENTRLRSTFEQAVAAERKSAAELAAMKAQRVALMDYFQQAYLSPSLAASPSPARATLERPAGEQGLRTRQEVIRRSRLIERCAQIRATMQGVGDRELLDRLEAVLTKLDLLDVQDPSAVEAFFSLVRASDMTGQIDKALGDDREDAALRTWLFETMLVLRRPNRAG